MDKVSMQHGNLVPILCSGSWERCRMKSLIVMHNTVFTVFKYVWVNIRFLTQ